MDYKIVKKELVQLSDKEKINTCKHFYKPHELKYINFLGVPVPLQRKIVNKYKYLDLSQLDLLLKDKYHECKITALLFLVEMMKTATKNNLILEQKKYFDFYCEHFDFINTWDLVDLSAHEIIGVYFENRDRNSLHELVKHENFWVQRIAMVSTWNFIRAGDLDCTFEFAMVLLSHKNDLIQKAVGWMLREAGKKDFNRLYNFLLDNKKYKNMPRTTLRYAIEKFPEELRQKILKDKF